MYKADILAICPNARPDIADAIVAAGDAAWKRFGIDTPVVQAKFIGQVVHESASLALLEENLNYTAQRLCCVWPKRFPSLESAQPYANNPEKLANHVYGGRLGNTEEGDGWRYRGRGLIQLTGRDNYREIGKHIGVDLENMPDLAARPDIAFLAALAFWQIHVGDQAKTASVAAITKIINGGTNGLTERELLTERAVDMLVPGRMKPRVLERGTKGNDVRLLQAQLVELGAQINIDGTFGPATAAAVRQYQTRHCLYDTGIYDDATRLSLSLILEAERTAIPPADGDPVPDEKDTVMLAAKLARSRYGDIMAQDRIELSAAYAAQINRIKDLGIVLWAEIKSLDTSREAATALTNLEQAVMWAEKSIIINQSRKGT